MNTVIQWILVGVFVVGAIAAVVRRFRRQGVCASCPENCRCRHASRSAVKCKDCRHDE